MQKKYLYFMAAAHFSNDVNSGALPALLPFFVAYYGMDYTSIAGLMFAGSFLASVVQPLFGYLADRKSRQWFMGFGIMLTGVFLGFTGLLENYWLIFASVTVMGIGSSIFHPEAAKLVNMLSGAKKGRGMSIFSVGGNAGFGLGPLIAVFMVTTFGMKGTLFFSCVGVVMGITMLLMSGRIRDMVEKAVGRAEIPVSDPKKDNAAPAEPVGENDWHSFGKLTFVIILRSVVSTGVRSFLPMFCISVLLASHALGSATLSVLSIAGIFSTLIGGRLADRFGYAKILKTGCVCMVPVLFFAVWSHQLWVIYALLIPLSLTVQGTYSAFVVLGQSYLSKSVGFASGVTLGLSFSAGGMLVPVLGKFSDTFGIESGMWLVVCLALCCALGSLLLPEPKKAA